MNIQGRVTVDGVAFDGSGQFKFALVRGAGGLVLWTHDGTSSGQGFQPVGSVVIQVTKGIYSVLLGDTSIIGMSNPINPSIFANDDVRLRVWFNDGSHGFQQLIPDQRLGSVGYAYKSEVADQATAILGNVPLAQLPSVLLTNNATNVTLTGEFIGDGSGITGIRGSTPFQVANAQTNNAVGNTGYMVTNAIERVVLLPASDTLKVGDIIRVAGPGSWKIAQRAGQSILATQFRGAVGASWTGRDAVRNWSGITSSTNFMTLAAVVYGRFVHISTNGGANWFAPALSPSKNWVSVAMSGDGQRILAGPEGDFLFVSPDFGQSWSGRSLPGNRVWSGVAMSDDGTNMVAVSTSGPLFTSHDGGDTWIQRNISRNWTAAAMSADGFNIVAVSETGLAISSDKGVNWASPLNGGFTAVACSADGRKIATTLGNAIYTSDDLGVSWIRRDAAGAKTWSAITCSADGSIIAATAPDGISISVDGGGAWTVRASARNWQGITCSPDGLRFAAVAFNGLIYTSEARQLRTTTTGTAGYLAGGEHSAVELQYAGGGRFSTLSSFAQIFAY